MAERSDPSLVPLYPRLMGTAWTTLDEAVRRTHLDGGSFQGGGVFRVRRGTGLLARLLLRIARLPSEAEAVHTRLVVTPLGSAEKWVRTFGNATWETTQVEEAGQILSERRGAIELRFRLEVEDGALIYRQVGAAVRLGRLAIPFPRWCRPLLEAREEAVGPSRTKVSVVLTVPCAGFLISYDGQIQREGPG
jgi:hypothetical protein